MSILVNKNPCRRDCPDRHQCCWSGCKKWVDWHDQLNAEKKALQQNRMISGYQTDELRKKQRGYTRLGYKIKGSSR